MTEHLKILSIGPGASLQDRGRPGWLEYGVSRGGAADLLALAEGAALLRQSPDLAALELATMGGEFESSTDTVIALTGAPMAASLDGTTLAWNASHHLPAGARLQIGAVQKGCYGYLHVAGGFDGPAPLGARSVHVAAGIGQPCKAGDTLPLGPATSTPTAGLGLTAENRFDGGTIRIVESLQTTLFPEAERQRFENTEFRRASRGNRMGVALDGDGASFQPDGGRTVLSEVITPGDIQITGDGTPYLLLSECQTTGGYPRIGTALPCDLPKLAQAQPGTLLRFQFISQDDAIQAERHAAQDRQTLPARCQPLIRDPHKMTDLLSYQLISGAIAGDEDDL
ncbi:biotin-dependent carboxyltransferase family protein [Phaeobacter sp.]|uniref:5-oxoprolinase subunit C family protein n=1 Tax=Phaeobacter sp. TaxID=1902409 RepID=UPI0025E7BF0F|nr:biotin-dependent carboxyltransferase family protein [Phaeobacter sp.]